MKFKFCFDFIAGAVNDKFMNLQLIVDNQLMQNIAVNEKFSIESIIELPAQIKFLLSGKTNNDTIVENGKIVSDKYIALEKITIDRFEINPWALPKENFILTSFDNLVEHTNYWGKNGNVTLIINDSDFISWLINNPSLLLQ